MTGRAAFKGWRRATIAVAMAYALALQALLFALGGALHAEAAAGVPGGFICERGLASSRDSSQDSSQAPASSHDALCCAWSCGIAAPPAGPPPAAAAIVQPAGTALAAAILPVETAFLPLSRVLPVGSRAPPRLG